MAKNQKSENIALFDFCFVPKEYQDEAIVLILKKEVNVKDELISFHKELGLFHSSKFQELKEDIEAIVHEDSFFAIPLTGYTKPAEVQKLKDCLQVLHGVQLKVTGSNILMVDQARFWKMTNVIRYVENAILQDPVHFLIRPIHNFASFYNMRRLMKKLLGDVDTAEKLKEIVSKMKLDSMSGEMMKQITRRFFSY